jgi:hypothetical protein
LLNKSCYGGQPAQLEGEGLLLALRDGGEVLLHLIRT